MKSAQSLAGLLLLAIIQSSWQVPDQDTDENSVLLSESSMLNEPILLPKMKRHSEGMLTSDINEAVTLEKIRKLIEMLKNSETPRIILKRHADGTYTSDVSSYLQDQAAKEFVSWLKTGRGRRD